MSHKTKKGLTIAFTIIGLIGFALSLIVLIPAYQLLLEPVHDSEEALGRALGLVILLPYFLLVAICDGGLLLAPSFIINTVIVAKAPKEEKRGLNIAVMILTCFAIVSVVFFILYICLGGANNSTSVSDSASTAVNAVRFML